MTGSLINYFMRQISCCYFLTKPKAIKATKSHPPVQSFLNTRSRQRYFNYIQPTGKTRVYYTYNLPRTNDSTNDKPYSPRHLNEWPSHTISAIPSDRHTDAVYIHNTLSLVANGAIYLFDAKLVQPVKQICIVWGI